MKTKPAPNYDPIKVQLTPYEQEIEDSIDETAPLIHASAELLTEVRLAAKNTLKVIHGGKRDGAGRKPREYVRTTVLLTPLVREKLETLALQHGGLSRAVEAAIIAQH